jgi:tetratricopeptide (TPR) repeat protein
MVLALEAKADCQPALDALTKLGVLTAIYESPRDAASLTYVRADAVLEYLVSQWEKEPRDLAFFLEQLTYHEHERRHALVLAAADRAIDIAGAAGSERAELARVAALRSLGRGEDAIQAAQAFIAKSPSSAGAHVELAQCFYAAGRNDEGEGEVDRALAIDPGDQSALLLRFWPADHNDIEKVNALIPRLTAFAETHPASPGIWRSLGRAKRIINAVDESLALFAKAVSLAPHDDELRAEYWAELGKQQRYSEILADAAKVENMGKRDWKLRWNEAEAFAGLGKKVEARAAFSAINYDETLHVDVRKRAKRAVKAIDEGASTTA